MVAARLCGISFSLTLHGSDLLLHPAFLDTKLAECKFCLTISEFNRSHILHHYPRIDPNKILLRRMGTSAIPYPSGADDHSSNHLVILAVGRLHRSKITPSFCAPAESSKRGAFHFVVGLPAMAPSVLRLIS
jgi:hypothetical protein